MAAKRKKAKKKKPASCNGALCFHGAFSKRGDAELKKARKKGAFILKKFLRRGDYRYIVATRDTATDFNF